jgi:hypothetical protein
MRSFATQERERKDDDDFEMATHKTLEAVQKQTSKDPLPYLQQWRNSYNCFGE